MLILSLISPACLESELPLTVDAPQRWPLDAYCSVTVRGVGTLDVETDYLPHVIACENGAASFEALRAQAVSARSYM